MKIVLAKAISIIFHPLFIIGYVLTFLMMTNPYIFGFSSDKAQGLVIISIVTISVMFPMVAIFMMKALGLISTMEMADKKERIGPLIVTGLFYMWLYVNVRNNDNIPGALSFFILGSTISVFFALMINSFSKISLHTIDRLKVTNVLQIDASIDDSAIHAVAVVLTRDNYDNRFYRHHDLTL